MRKIVDCISYCYEPSALAVRLLELDEVVDLHVIVSGNHTYRGKPQHVDAVSDMEAAGLMVPELARIISTKVIFREVDLPPGESRLLAPGLTATEKIQRDSTVTEAFGVAGGKALYLVTDCDEIPHPDTVAQAALRYPAGGPSVLRVDARCWFADWSAAPNGNPWQTKGHHRNQPILASFADITRLGGAQWARSARGFTRIRRWPLARGPVGWHLSNLDGVGMVRDKFGRFSHMENDNDGDRDPAYLQKCIDERMWPVHHWPLTHTDDTPSSIHTHYPHLLGD